MKKIIYLLIAYLFLFVPVVSANEINKINMDIYIDQNGVANIKEEWTVKATSGTEIYKTYNNIGTSTFKDFKVSLNGTDFQNIGSWNVNSSFDAKAYKNGIHEISDGLELCFGISKYGTNTYTFEYKITNFVVNLNDAQMVYWTLIPRNLSNKVDEVYIKVYSDFKYSDTLDVWGYGKYGAPTYVYDGYIEMSTENLSSSEYMTMLIKFPSGTFDLETDLDEEFDYYLNQANEGSTKYTDDSNSTKKSSASIFLSIITVIINLFGYIFVIYILILLINNAVLKNRKYKKSTKKIPKDTPAFRDIPKGGLYYNYYISNLYSLTKKQTDLLGAVLLKWLKDGYITIEKIEKKGLFKKSELVSSMKISNVVCESPLEEELYQMIKSAAKDDYLEEKEFEKWSKNHYDRLLGWFDKVESNEADTFIEKGLVTKEIVKKGLIKTAKYTEDEQIFEQALKLYGLKKYLTEFSNMKEKTVMEVKLWEDYLIFAQMFGIAKEVAAQFKKMYPEVIEGYNYDFDTIILINNFSNHAVTSAQTARQEAIDRANSYSSGGGGFSSGGGGGGSFGGGSGGGGFR